MEFPKYAVLRNDLLKFVAKPWPNDDVLGEVFNLEDVNLFEREMGIL
jgi:hypothetical protein